MAGPFDYRCRKQHVVAICTAVCSLAAAAVSATALASSAGAATAIATATITIATSTVTTSDTSVAATVRSARRATPRVLPPLPVWLPGSEQLQPTCRLDA